jgi:dihydrofolate reductase
MIISIIVAGDLALGIGYQNQMLCHMPADLAYFKRTTLGHHVLMGRKTFESIGKPLPGRTNVVVTSSTMPIAGCQIVHSIEEGIEMAQKNGEQELFVIGGGTLYQQTIDRADKVYFTQIHHQFIADTHFPKLDSEHWQMISKTSHGADEKNAFDYEFIVYERVKKSI